MSRKHLKPRDKVTQRMTRDGVVLENQTTGEEINVCLPFPSAKIWIGKGLALTAVLFISNLLMWLFTTGIASFTTMNISPLDSIIGCMLLFLTCLWQLPFLHIVNLCYNRNCSPLVFQI